MATTNKYDRQLRLWGAAGQKALAESCVVLVGATAAGTETLKNLVLPGVGAFGVIDDHVTVTAADVAVNFFTTTMRDDTNNDDGDKSNKTRAATAAALLQELNPDVRSAHTTVADLVNIAMEDWEKVFNKVSPNNNNSSSSNDNNNNITSRSSKKISFVFND
uniref:THIF-type NAD/FAD binding fold domain-containing protein n=1 Tax=Amphora coffeiformis TaxID=265554 RepID=A0A7S3L0F1_9STRA